MELGYIIFLAIVTIGIGSIGFWVSKEDDLQTNED